MVSLELGKNTWINFSVTSYSIRIDDGLKYSGEFVTTIESWRDTRRLNHIHYRRYVGAAVFLEKGHG